MERIKKEDLCGSCRQLMTKYGKSVEDMLDYFYNNPVKMVEQGGDVGVCVMLTETIVLGNGCTSCGEKVLNLGKDLGLSREPRSSTKEQNSSNSYIIGKVIKYVLIGIGIILFLKMCTSC